MLVTPVVEATNLRVSLGGMPILRDATFTVDTGEAVALLGANGSGKTTLLRAILRLIPHQFGTIRLFGTAVDGFRDWSRIGYVPQRASLSLHSTTVRELVASGRLSRRRPFVPASATDKRLTTQALEHVALADRAKDAFVHLSGGQQQRALIARALVGESDLLVLDEPFAGVDLRHQESLAAILRDFK